MKRVVSWALFSALILSSMMLPHRTAFPPTTPGVTSISHLPCFGVFTNKSFIKPRKLWCIVVHIQDFHCHGDAAHLRGVIWRERHNVKKGSVQEGERGCSSLCSTGKAALLLLTCVKWHFCIGKCSHLDVVWLGMKLQMLLSVYPGFPSKHIFFKRILWKTLTWFSSMGLFQ